MTLRTEGLQYINERLMQLDRSIFVRSIFVPLPSSFSFFLEQDIAGKFHRGEPAKIRL